MPVRSHFSSLLLQNNILGGATGLFVLKAKVMRRTKQLIFFFLNYLLTPFLFHSSHFFEEIKEKGNYI